MLEDEVVSCPFCDHEMSVKVSRFGKNATYLVSQECLNCKASASKIENLLNKSTNKRRSFNVEKSYIKLDPRG